MNISDRIIKRMSELKLRSVDVINKTGISKGTISQWRKGTANPSGKNLILLCKVLGVDPDWLLYGTGSPTRAVDSENTISVPHVKPVPLISWIQAGAFCEAGQLAPLDESTEYYPCPVRNAGPRTYALQVKGDSMTAAFPGMRSYPEGTIIFVDPDRSAMPGQRVVARLGSACTFKQLMEDESGQQYLKPLNDRHELIKPEDGVQVCGLVIGAFMQE